MRDVQFYGLNLAYVKIYQQKLLTYALYIKQVKEEVHWQLLAIQVTSLKWFDYHPSSQSLIGLWGALRYSQCSMTDFEIFSEEKMRNYLAIYINISILKLIFDRCIKVPKLKRDKSVYYTFHLFYSFYSFSHFTHFLIFSFYSFSLLFKHQFKKEFLVCLYNAFFRFWSQARWQPQ